MDDNERTIQDISLYCSPHSILVLNKVGMIYRLCCPFQVKPRHQVHILEEGRVYYVSAVKLSPDLVMLYIISGTAYQYSLFFIL